MSFKYCRAYSWPNSKDNWALSKMYFERMVDNVKELELKLPCEFAIFLAYEEKEFPFASIALDMDYHAVAATEISQILDDFKSKLGEPIPASVENPGWFTSVDSNYKSTLLSHGITLCEGEFYKRCGAPQPGGNTVRFDGKLITFLVELINLYNPQRKSLLSKPIMSYNEKNKFIATFSPSLDSKVYQVGTEPESLAGALSSAQIIASKLGDDYTEMVVKLCDTSNKLILGFLLKDGEFAVIVGDDYSSKKENSTFRIV